ncbi:MAG: DUF1638 domain-containing protein [Actinomycetota bacterium]|nr:DUF1638 domain-containing protein [Actinomycetota bacterium]
MAVIACGAIAQPVADVVARRGWPADVHPLPPLLHNQPQRIVAAVEELVDRLAPAYAEVVVGYADCGTYGALDELCARRGLRRLAGLHCYDVYAGPDRIRELFESQPGTYVLTDFLVRSFARTVLAELGLDRHPELREDYFGHYTQVVWLAQAPDDELRTLAEEAAARIGLPLQEVPVGDAGLEHQLALLLCLRPDACRPDAEIRVAGRERAGR